MQTNKIPWLFDGVPAKQQRTVKHAGIGVLQQAAEHRQSIPKMNENGRGNYLHSTLATSLDVRKGMRDGLVDRRDPLEIKKNTSN